MMEHFLKFSDSVHCSSHEVHLNELVQVYFMGTTQEEAKQQNKIVGGELQMY